MKQKLSPTGLSNPNDDSQGQCYAPVENKVVNKAKKQHIPEGEAPPQGWIQVDCDANCQFLTR